MKWLANIKTFTKIIGLALILLFFIACTGGIGYYYNQKANSDMTELYNDRLLPIQWLNENRAHARAVQGYLFDLMLNTDMARNTVLKNEMDKRAEAFNKNLVAYEKTKLDSFEVTALKEMKQYMQKFRDAREGVVALAMQNKNAEAYALFNAQAREPMEKFLEKLVALSEYNVKVAGEINVQNGKDYIVAVRVILGVCIFALFVGIFLAWSITRAITVPMGAVVSRLGIMAEGDYSKDIQAAFLMRRDEFGNIAHAFDKLNKNTRSMIKRVSQSAEQLAASSEELTADRSDTVTI